MHTGRQLASGVPNITDQITQSQSVGLLPMPRSSSRLDQINENPGTLLKLQEVTTAAGISGNIQIGGGPG